jgi:SapC protein
MAENKQSGPIDGSKFLYAQPELLNKEDHGSLGFTAQERPFEYTRNVRAIPLTMVEFGSAQRHYPVVFSRLQDPVPLAVVGLSDDVNLFVDDGGEWDPMCYLPSYLRCYPFAFASEREGRMAVVVDRAAASVTENPVYPFFVDDEISEHTEALMRFCTQHERERKRTQEFCDKLIELDLLTQQRSTHKPDGATEAEPLADYVSIDVEKLNELDSDVVFDLHKNGQLSAIYLQLYSLENWRHLVARRVTRAA